MPFVYLGERKWYRMVSKWRHERKGVVLFLGEWYNFKEDLIDKWGFIELESFKFMEKNYEYKLLFR